MAHLSRLAAEKNFNTVAIHVWASKGYFQFLDDTLQNLATPNLGFAIWVCPKLGHIPLFHGIFCGEVMKMMTIHGIWWHFQTNPHS